LARKHPEAVLSRKFAEELLSSLPSEYGFLWIGKNAIGGLRKEESNLGSKRRKQVVDYVFDYVFRNRALGLVRSSLLLGHGFKPRPNQAN
jgi:hypothetical protein